MLVRRLTPADARLAVEVVRRYKSRQIGLQHAERFLACDTHVLIVAHEGDAIWGFLLAYALPRLDRNSAKLFIYEVEVAAEQRRHGIGRAMIEAALTIARAAGMMAAFVPTVRANIAAMGLYAATGGIVLHDDDVLFTYLLEGPPWP